MTPRERDLLALRYMEIEQEIAEIQAYCVVRNWSRLSLESMRFLLLTALIVLVGCGSSMPELTIKRIDLTDGVVPLNVRLQVENIGNAPAVVDRIEAAACGTYAFNTDCKIVPKRCGFDAEMRRDGRATRPGEGVTIKPGETATIEGVVLWRVPDYGPPMGQIAAGQFWVGTKDRLLARTDLVAFVIYSRPSELDFSAAPAKQKLELIRHLDGLPGERSASVARLLKLLGE